MVEKGPFSVKRAKPTYELYDSENPKEKRNPEEKKDVSFFFSFNIHYFHKINGNLLKVAIPDEVFFSLGCQK